MTRTLTTLVLAVIGALLFPTAAHASADWVPDRVVVMDLPEAYGPGQPDLNVKPGDVLDITWARGSNGVTDPQVGGVSLLADSPQFAPAGPDSKSGTTYPAYTTPMEIARTTLSPMLYDRDPRQGGAKQVWTPGEGSLVWASDQRVEYEGSTWVRIGWGINDAWIPADALAMPDLRDEQQRAWDRAKEGQSGCGGYCAQMAHDAWDALCAARPGDSACAGSWAEAFAGLCATTWSGRDECAQVAAATAKPRATRARPRQGAPQPEPGKSAISPGAALFGLLVLSGGGALVVALRRRRLKEKTR